MAKIGSRHVRTLTIGLALSLVLAGAVIFGGSLNGSSPEDLTTYTVGPPGHGLEIAAAPSQNPLLATTPGPPPANAIVPNATTHRGILALASGGLVRVTISVSASQIPKALAWRVIHGYFNNTPEHLTTWHGQVVDRGVVSCSTPSGPCPGYVGGMTELRGNTLYDMWVQSASSDTAWAVVNSFKISS